MRKYKKRRAYKKINKLDLLKTVPKAKSFRHVSRILDNTPKKIKKKCELYNIDTSHFYKTGRSNIGIKPYGLKILDVIGINKSGDKTKYYAECICDCGGSLTTRLDHVKNGRVRYCSAKCTRVHNNTLGLGNTNPCFKGVGQIGSTFFADIKNSAKKRNIAFNITIEYVSKLYDQQKGKCALSGMDIEFGPTRTSATTASLDRIDSSLPYQEGNVQWVHKLVNRMKIDISQETYIKICNLVAQKHKTKTK